MRGDLPPPEGGKRNRGEAVGAGLIHTAESKKKKKKKNLVHLEDINTMSQFELGGGEGDGGGE